MLSVNKKNKNSKLSQRQAVCINDLQFSFPVSSIPLGVNVFSLKKGKTFMIENKEKRWEFCRFPRSEHPSHLHIILNFVILRPLIGTSWILKSRAWRCLQPIPRIYFHIWFPWLLYSHPLAPKFCLQYEPLHLPLRSFPVYQAYSLSIMILIHSWLDSLLLWRHCLMLPESMASLLHLLPMLELNIHL